MLILQDYLSHQVDASNDQSTDNAIIALQPLSNPQTPGSVTSQLVAEQVPLHQSHTNTFTTESVIDGEFCFVAQLPYFYDCRNYCSYKIKTHAAITLYVYM